MVKSEIILNFAAYLGQALLKQPLKKPPLSTVPLPYFGRLSPLSGTGTKKPATIFANFAGRWVLFIHAAKIIIKKRITKGKPKIPPLINKI